MNWVELTHSWVEIVGTVITTGAVLTGAWWFFTRRASIRKANVSHEVTFVATGDDVYVNVQVRIKNSGNRQIIIDGGKPRKGDTWSNTVLIEEVIPYLESNDTELIPGTTEYQMLSLAARAFPGKLKIEPDEEQAMVFDFRIPARTQVVRVYSFIDDDYNNDSGWNTITIHRVETI